MKILHLSHKPPYPPVDGGSIAINNISMGLAEEGVELKLISINTPKHFVDVDSLPESYREAVNPEFVFVNTEVNPLGAFKNLFSGKSYHLSRFTSKDLEDKIVSELKNTDYDYILFESIFLSNYVPLVRQFSKAKVILRSHNIEFLIWERIAEQEKNIAKKKYLELLSSRLRKEELTHIHQYDAMVCVSSKDQEFFLKQGFAKPITTIPIGIDVTKDLSISASESDFPGLFMLGALDWIPNQEGIFWFIEKCWPELRKRFPELSMKIAGRRPSDQILGLKAEGVQVLGEIEDAAQYLKENSIMIVPLFSGSGIRVKIIEGMMMGKVVISTSIGAEGIPCTSGNELFIANTHEQFVHSISQLIGDRAKYKQVSEKAIHFANEHFSNHKLNTDLLSFLSSL